MFIFSSQPVVYCVLILIFDGLIGVRGIRPYIKEDVAEEKGQLVSVELHIYGDDETTNFTTNLSTYYSIVNARQKLHAIYPVKTEQQVALVINDTLLDLITYPVVFGENFTFKIGNKEVPTVKDSYHPVCLMSSSKGIEYEASFDLCEGVNGYYKKGNKQYTIHSKEPDSGSEPIQHFVHTKILKQEYKPRNVSRLLPLVEGIEKRERRKRGIEAPTYYVETYLAVDYDFFERACWWQGYYNESYCAAEVHSYFHWVGLLYRTTFDLTFVTVGIEVWRRGNEIETIPMGKNLTTKEYVSRWLDHDIPLYGEKIRKTRNFDAFLYITKTNGANGHEIAGLAKKVDSACHVNESYAYVDVFIDFDHGVLTMAHELAHILGAFHVKAIDPKCLCNHTSYNNITHQTVRCIMEASLKGAWFNTIWSECTKSMLRTNLGWAGPCLKNVPAFNDSYIRCGNGITESSEHCEPYPGVKCCTWNCKLHPHAQCAQGPCCNFKTCNFRELGYQCRPRKGECDFDDYCPGDRAECMADRRSADGSPCFNQGNGYCKNGYCNTLNSACSTVYKDAIATAVKRPCWNELAKRSINANERLWAATGEMWNGKGDFFCKDLSCNISNTDPSWAYTGMLTKVQYFVVNGSTGPQRLFCPTIEGFHQGMIYHNKDVLSYRYLMDGVACGPHHYCEQTKCVAIPWLDERCHHCTAEHFSCDQNETCFCDRRAHGTYCHDWHTGPIKRGIYPYWWRQFGFVEPEKLIGYVPDPKYQKENTEQGRVALIVVPTLVVFIALVAIIVFVMRNN